MLVDTGASVNITSKQVAKQLNGKVILQIVKSKIYAYGSDQPLPVDDRFTAEVSHKSRLLAAEFAVSRHGDDTLLSYLTATELGLVRIASNVSEDGADPHAVKIL